MSEGFRLSLLQRRLFFLEAGQARTVAAVEVPAGIAPAAVRTALAQIVARHEILRTFFVPSPGIKVPLQVIADEADLDWSEEPGDWEAVFARERGRPADPERGARLRAVLVGRTLILSLPGLCADAATLHRLTVELAALVAGGEQEEASQYVDAAEWQRERFESGDEEAELGRSHWRRQSQDFRFPALPFEGTGTGEGSSLSLTLPSERLTAVAREHSLAPADLLRAAWWLCLRRLSGDTGEASTAIAEPFEDDALEGVLGPLSRWIPLQAALDDDLRFHQAAAHLSRLREEAAGWQRWYEPPGGDEPSAWPCGFEHGAGTAGTDGSLPVLRVAGAEPVRLLLSVQERGVATLSYDSERYSAADLEKLAAGFLHLLDAALADPAVRVGELTLAAPGTGASLPADAGDTAAFDLRPVHQRIEEAARRNPGAPAVTVDDRTISYADLDAGSNRLARALRSRGLVTGPDVPVALYLERSPELIVALLGILKAGGAYVPFDTSQPARRLAVMVEEVRPAVVLTQASLAPNLPPEVPAILLDAEIAALAAEPAEPLGDRSLPESLTYVIFTSGSTGRPKGVGVEHRHLAAYVDGVSRRLDLQPGWSWASVSTVAADLGHTAIFPCLSTGGHLHLISQERASDAEALAEYFSRHPVDGLKIVPTHLEALQATGHPERVLPRRRLVLGGEASRGPWAEELRRRAAASPDLRLFNHYGPTETTVGVLTFPLDAPLDARQPTVPIGRPLPGAAVHLLDRQGKPVAPWEPGEVHLGGAQVSRGYLGRPDLTAERFVPDPFSGQPGARLYRTGDLARLILGKDGQDAVEFLGRRDHQVKYHGFRVELNEVRAALTSHPLVREGVVQLARDAAGLDALIAYYVSRQEIDPAELRALLSQTLIEEVVPNLFVHLRKLPLTLNGKINYRALPGLDEVRSQAAKAFVPPRTPAEEAVAQVWSEVLGIEKVGVEANFFELGGHSLLATRIISRLRESRGAEIPLRALFETPTVAALARRIDEQAGAGTAPGAAPAIIPSAIPTSAASIEDQLAELEGLGE